ncbi:hypothetical protein ABKN59_005840, partial [Abortiporus biennis]
HSTTPATPVFSSEHTTHHTQSQTASINLIVNKSKTHIPDKDLSEVRFKHTIIAQPPPVGLPCSNCSKTFKNVEGLQEHIRTKHGTKFRCPVCSQSFSKQKSLNKHIKNIGHNTSRVGARQGASTSTSISSARDQLSCCGCSEKFCSQRILDAHVATSHPELRPQCSQCSLAFNSTIDYNNHIRSCNIQSCVLCNQKFPNHTALNEHISSIHVNVKCPCGEEYYALEAQQHWDTSLLHPHCKLCNVGFPDSVGLRQHLDSKHPLSQKCSICDERFADLSGLDIHVKEKHGHSERMTSEGNEKDGPIEETQKTVFLETQDESVAASVCCSLCSKIFENKEKLDHHETTLHRRCVICSTVVADQIALAEHLSVIHALVQCWCGEWYDSAEHAQCHWQTSLFHPHCEICEIGFASNDDLRQHMLSQHPPDTECPICGEACESISDLSGHCGAEHNYPEFQPTERDDEKANEMDKKSVPSSLPSSPMTKPESINENLSSLSSTIDNDLQIQGAPKIETVDDCQCRFCERTAAAQGREVSSGHTSNEGPKNLTAIPKFPAIVDDTFTVDLVSSSSQGLLQESHLTQITRPSSPSLSSVSSSTSRFTGLEIKSHLVSSPDVQARCIHDTKSIEHEDLSNYAASIISSFDSDLEDFASMKDASSVKSGKLPSVVVEGQMSVDTINQVEAGVVPSVEQERVIPVASSSDITIQPELKKEEPTLIITEDKQPRLENTVLSKWCCRICLLDDPVNPVVAMCGHIFCQRCIIEHLPKSLECPACRKVFFVKLNLSVS